jgi:hypothetical protein
MICLGLILKDRLQKLWREKKIEELVYYLILKIVRFPLSHEFLPLKKCGGYFLKVLDDVVSEEYTQLT